MLRILKNWFSGKRSLPSVKNRPARRTVLNLEGLEARWVPATVQFSVASEAINETAGNFYIPVTLVGTANGDVSVPFSLGGTAVADKDYSGATVSASPLVIRAGAGQTTATITGSLLSDPGVNRTLIFTLFPPSGGPTLGTTTVNTLFINEPATVQFNAASETVNETAGNFNIPVALSGTVMPTASTFASGIGAAGLAFDAAGNLYVANGFDGTINKVTPAGVVSPFANTGINTSPGALAFDAAGNLYVALPGIGAGSGTVEKVTPAGVVGAFASGFTAPDGLAFDAAGNLYVSDQTNNVVDKVTPAGVISTFASGFNNPEGLAFDTAGNLYVANGGFGYYSVTTVSKVTAGGVVSTFATGFIGNLGDGMAFDATGNLYFDDFFTGAVYKVTPAGMVITYANRVVGEGLAIDAAGNLYVGNGFGVSKITVPAVSVSLLLGGTAMAGTDYSGISASPLVIPSGQTTGTITGTLPPHTGATRTLTITLDSPSGASLGSPSGNTLTITGPVLTIQGNPNDTLNVQLNTSPFYVLNNVFTNIPSWVTTLKFVGANSGISHSDVYGSGNDVATITGGPNAPVVKVVENGFTVELDNVAVATAHSSGANSTATFTLGSGDTFVGRYDYSQIVQPQNTYYLGAVGFATTTATAVSGSNSEAWMKTAPTSTNDSMTGTPTSTSIQGQNYSSTAKNFAFAAVFAGNGTNSSANLSTSADSGDIMGGVPAYSFVQGTVHPYLVYAVGFHTVTANALGANAIAYIATSNGSGDQYIGNGTTSEVKGATYDITVKNFAIVEAFCGGGSNQSATLHHPPGDYTKNYGNGVQEIKAADGSYDDFEIGFDPNVTIT